MIKMKLKNKWFIRTFAIGRASRRIALQDAVILYLDLCREALKGFRLYRLNTASSLRESNRRRLLESQGQQESRRGRVALQNKTESGKNDKNEIKTQVIKLKWSYSEFLFKLLH